MRWNQAYLNRQRSNRRRWNSQNRASREVHGFTLLEVVLAISLSVILLGMISSAVYLHVRVLQRQQTTIERTQIARNVLMMISRDLRQAIQYKPADVTGLEELSQSQAAIAGTLMGMDTSGVDTSGLDLSGGTGGQSTGESSTGSGSSSSSSGDAGADDSQAPPPDISGTPSEVLRPGLYGNSTEIMVDVSRLPRIDQYDPLVTGDQSEAMTLPTDVKTIAYFVSAESMESQGLQTGVDPATSGGLYRRRLDRAVASYSADLAATLADLGSTKLIANEVIGIQFRYFDGENWVDEWNSDDAGGFPAAVEITILVDNERAISPDVDYRMQSNPESGAAYRSVVNLPVAEILEEESSSNSAQGGGR